MRFSSNAILPSKIQINIDNILHNTDIIYTNVSSYQSRSKCPICGIYSINIHSKYTRKLVDVAISGKRSRFELNARRFFCYNPDCRRKVFTERFQYEIKPYARRMNRANDLLGKLALESGGNVCSKFSKYVGIPVSASTILRIIKRIVNPSSQVTSGIIGLDDWAYKKGHSYGTIIVDLQKGQVIDLLPDRAAETVTQWLKQHPEITVVSRDRFIA